MHLNLIFTFLYRLQGDQQIRLEPPLLQEKRNKEDQAPGQK